MTEALSMVIYANPSKRSGAGVGDITCVAIGRAGRAIGIAMRGLCCDVEMRKKEVKTGRLMAEDGQSFCWCVSRILRGLQRRS